MLPEKGKREEKKYWDVTYNMMNTMNTAVHCM